MRADLLLVSQGLAPTRSSAQRLIAGSAAQWRSPKGWVALKKAGEDLPETAELRVSDDAELRFVSRGGLKLEGALARSSIAVSGLTVLDMGQSTGGFSDCLLKAGAARVVGVDVGHGQLHASLTGEPRLVALEGLHVRELAGSALAAHAPVEGFDLIVGDLSFISMLGALPHLAPWLKPEGQVLLLIKPQFEVGPQHVGRGGLVKDARQYALLETRACEAAKALGWRLHGYFESAIAGGDGNTEYFLWAQAGPAPVKE
ncbi:TlyA family RNA methyltransferase [Roseateles toxinivorans]|uniref:23S rRNA (Cytidine1920-2'-O)/16S rRNA (Cytidine1409-2'-O)-methyltransferase n=1 Tax=Roseateles toxinivorans TaxID=270368 RepID=A0A4R6QJ32_9BURK|nr:TlyA family RNA methyltransferase [Roseateles toxinivorans]TDP62203.1 23S rRNA (cytidine1920-2'-O)/16S rRNA (cytidine1409-2'-O)-methyltransferase [Roseateles toxinivorans]